MNEEFWKWALPFAAGLAGLLLGVPLRAWRRMRELDLVEVLKPHFWTRIEQGAFERQNDMKHDRSDEMMRMLHDAQAANTALSGAVARLTEAVKFWGEKFEDLESEVEELKRRKNA